MGDQFDFSLLIGSQYDGGPMEWDEQTLYVSTGTILNHVDINKVRPAPSVENHAAHTVWTINDFFRIRVNH